MEVSTLKTSDSLCTEFSPCNCAQHEEKVECVFLYKTWNFVQIDFIRIGEFGDVYKGKLTKPNKKKITVAVKILKVFKL